MKNFNGLITGAGGFVMASKEISLLISPEAAILYGQLVSWSEMKIDNEDYIEIDGKVFFMFEMDEIELETGLTPRRIRPLLNKFIEMGLIEKVRTGRQAQNHFHIEEEALYNMLQEYEGTRRQRLKQIRAKRRKQNKEAAAETVKMASKPRKARKKPVKAAAPAAAEPAAEPNVDDLLPSGMDQAPTGQEAAAAPAAASSMSLLEIIRDKQLGAIYEYIEVSYNKNMPPHMQMTAEEIAEICLYIRNHTNYKGFDPLDVDQAFYELAALDPSQVSKPTHFLGAAISKAAGRRKFVNHAKSSEAAGNKSRAELVEYLRQKDPEHVLVKRYDEEVKAYIS